MPIFRGYAYVYDAGPPEVNDTIIPEKILFFSNRNAAIDSFAADVIAANDQLDPPYPLAEIDVVIENLTVVPHNQWEP